MKRKFLLLMAMLLTSLMSTQALAQDTDEWGRLKLVGNQLSDQSGNPTSFHLMPSSQNVWEDEFNLAWAPAGNDAEKDDLCVYLPQTGVQRLILTMSPDNNETPGNFGNMRFTPLDVEVNNGGNDDNGDNGDNGGNGDNGDNGDNGGNGDNGDNGGSSDVADTEAPELSDAYIKYVDKNAGHIILEWTEATDNVTATENIKYEIKLKKDSEDDDAYQMVATITGICTYTLKGLDLGTGYYVIITAIDEAGNRKEYKRYSFLTPYDVTYYFLDVAGNEVSDLNADDVLGDGSVSYEHKTHTLTLHNVNIQTNGTSFIYRPEKTELYVKLEGDNTIETTGATSIDCRGELNIYSEDGGTLNITANDEYGIYTLFRPINITNCKVNINASIVAMAASSSGITFDHADANLTVSDDPRAHVAEAEHAEYINGSVLTTPVNAQLNQIFIVDKIVNAYFYMEGKEKVACKKLVVEVNPDAINGIEGDTQNLPAYSTTGVRVGSNYKGIVIKSGKKYLQK